MRHGNDDLFCLLTTRVWHRSFPNAHGWDSIGRVVPRDRSCFHHCEWEGFLPEASFGLRLLSLPVSVCVCFNHLLVCTITRHLFKLRSPNLVHRSKTPWLRSLLFFFFFFFVFFLGGGNWPWPSRSNLTSNSKLTPFWACPHHYSPPILVRISKFGQQMHFSTVKIPGNSGLDWPWTSPSFLIPKLIYLHLGGVHWDCETLPDLFQCCSGTVSQSLHQCTWRTHSLSGMGPLVL